MDTVQRKVEVVSKSEIRNNDLGDYFIDENGCVVFKIADTGVDEYNTLILIHELIEELLTRRRGLQEKEITEFDAMFEKERQDGIWVNDEEPGFDNRCPYKKEHELATIVERMICHEAGIDFKTYDDYLISMYEL